MYIYKVSEYSVDLEKEMRFCQASYNKHMLKGWLQKSVV